MKAVQEGNIQWESRTYPYPGTPITQRFSHSKFRGWEGAAWGLLVPHKSCGCSSELPGRERQVERSPASAQEQWPLPGCEPLVFRVHCWQVSVPSCGGLTCLHHFQAAEGQFAQAFLEELAC